MKFKTLFVLFNIVMLLTFSFIFLMPWPVLGWEYALTFWMGNWPIALLFVAILLAIDSYFIVNGKLFRLLEREDWPGLRALLEAELARKGRLSVQKTRYLLNACLLGNQPGRIDEVREAYLKAKVSGVPRLALLLGLPLVLEGKSEAIEEFFAPFLADKTPDGPWIRWCVAYARLLRKDTAGARPLLEAGLNKKQPVLFLLSLYLLDNLRHGDEQVAARVDGDKAFLAARYTPKEWNASIEALKERVTLILFMENLFTKALQWLGSPKE